MTGAAKPKRRPPAPKPLSPPDDLERHRARVSARAMRLAIEDRSTMGERRVLHVDQSRPRRAFWITTWSNLPGFRRVNGRYEHDSLPGWSYARSEILPELIPDLEALAERGVRPTEATSHG